jgi:AbrB family looped-hinge helix DNA binding protein
MSVVTISQKGGVVIPAELRSKYQWKAGDRVKVVDYGGIVSLVPLLRDPEEAGIGVLKRRGRSLLKALKQARKEKRRHHQTSKQGARSIL